MAREYLKLAKAERQMADLSNPGREFKAQGETTKSDASADYDFLDGLIETVAKLFRTTKKP